MPVTQVVQIVNSSGKVVKTSKTLKSVWDEAKAAYDGKKSELQALRRKEAESKDKERKALRRMEGLTLDDDNVSRASSRRSSRSRRDDANHTKRKAVPARTLERPPVERGYSDSFYANDMQLAQRRPNRPSPLRRDSDNPLAYGEPRIGELTRRHTTDLERTDHHELTSPTRSASLDDIDMDLAYGELPPPLPERKYDTEVELRSKMTGLQRMLDEANCLQYSVTAIIDNLQKNPDALAAVALTLGEISNLASKLAPGALMSMKGSFPAIIALLASPEFAIAIGVGVGITVIAFGGYKIIKKIKANKEEARLLENGGMPQHAAIADEAEPESPMDELRELDRIELWRRGIADAEEGSLGTSVDGEFITPVATRTLIEEGRLTEADLKSTVSKGDKKKRKKSSKSESGSKSGSKSGWSKPSSKSKSKKEKEPSGLRMLFKKPQLA